MSKKIRLLAFLAAVTLTATAFGACTTEPTDDGATDTSTTDSSTDEGTDDAEGEVATAGEPNKYGWVVPEEPIEFSVAYGQGDPNEFDKAVANQLQVLKDEFNVIIEAHQWETDYKERQSLMLATGDYPDVITRISATDVADWVNANAAIDLKPIIESEVPAIPEEMGEYYNRYVSEDGTMYSLPNMWGYWGSPGYAPAIRLDWWEGVGGEEFTTPEEFYEQLKLMVEANPTGTDGNKTYALGMYNSTASFINVYGGMYGLYSGWDIDEEMNMTHWSQTDAGLEMTLWLNQIQRDGLLDPDSFSQTADELRSKYANERYAGWVGSWWQAWNYGHEQWNETREDWTEEQRYLHHDVVAEGLENSTMAPINSMGYYRTVITAGAEDKAADILNWMSYEMSEEGMRLIGWGIPNTEFSGWNLADDGTWEMDQEWVDLRIENTNFPFEDHEYTGTMSLNTTIRLAKGDRELSAYWDQNFEMEDPWKANLVEEMEDSCFDNAYLSSIIVDPTSDLANIKQTITDLSNSGWAQAVMAATEDECIALFEQMQADIQSAGVEEYQEFYTSEYQRLYTAWN